MGLRSIEEVAIQLGVSKTSIYNKLKLKEYKSRIVKKHGKSIDEDGLFNFNQELIRNLIEQLKEKDKQIEELINLNKNNQVLLKKQQDKEVNQKLLEDHFQEVDKKLMDLKEKMELRNSKRKFRFWNKKGY